MNLVKKRTYAACVLSNLVMVDEMMEEMLKVNAIGDLLDIVK
jgi:hypothetical protein